MKSKMQNPRNARFWYFMNGSMGDGFDGYVKVTLKPGQELTHESFCRHEEGWSRHSTTWYYDETEGVVTVQEFIDGTDCDGRMQTLWKGVCHVDDLRAEEFTVTDWNDKPIRTIKRPVWKNKLSRQRDFTAESMGY